MTWISLAMMSALLLGLYEVSKKAAVHGNAVLPSLLVGSLASLGLLLPLALLTPLAPAQARSLGLELGGMGPVGYLLILAKSVLVSASWVCTYFALKHLPLSLASPLRATAPLFTLLGAIVFFAERPAPSQWAGIVLILVSYWGFARVGKAEGIHFASNRWVGLLLLGTVLGSFSGLYDKHLLQNARLPVNAVQFWFAAGNVLVQSLLVALLWWPRRKRHTPFQWRWQTVAVGVLLVLADAVYFRALSRPEALISVVSLIRRSNVVVSFALGALAFREANRTRKLLPLAGILAGLALLLWE